VAERARSNQRLEVGSDVAAVLRPQEAARLHDVREFDRVRCAICGEWIEPDSSAATSVSVALHGDSVAVEFTHARCAPSHADLAPLVVLAQAEPLGIVYAQALHPEAGAVLLWERKLDLRVPRVGEPDECLYLDPLWWDGFHTALADEPVRLLADWLLRAEGEDLVLEHSQREVERFHGALQRSPPGWLDSLRESGFCLLIVGAGIGLQRPAAAAIQLAMRERRALLGLAEYEVT